MRRAHRQQIKNFVVAICFADKERKAQTRIFLKQHETSVLQTRVSTPKREVHVLVPKHETCVQTVPKHNFYVPTTQHEVHVLKQTLPKCEAKTRI